MSVNNYSFDRLYRKHTPDYPVTPGNEQPVEEDDQGTAGKLLTQNQGDDNKTKGSDRGRGLVGGGRGGDDDDGQGNSCLSSTSSIPPPSSPSRRHVFGRRIDDIMREEYGAFFDGMTPSSRQLYEVRKEEMTRGR